MQFRFTARLAAVLLASLVFPALAAAQDSCVPYPAPPSTYLICVPPGAPINIDLVVFAHGYVSPTVPAGTIPTDQLTLDGVSIPGLLNSLGFAFAVSSYPKNGLAIKEGITDLVSLVAFYRQLGYSPAKVYVVGVSEGGLVATKLIEAGGSVFNGGLALCGPIGDFTAQIDHFGDFRVLFDYFFPGVLTFSPVSIPPSAIADWDTVLAPRIVADVDGNSSATNQLYLVAQTPTDPTEPDASAVAVLWYNVFATDDATTELGGQPYGNRFKFYFGSSDDLKLNLHVERFSADPAALRQIQEFYQTTGRLPAPLVTMHTTGDPVVPFWHEALYGLKVLLSRSLPEYLTLPVVRYGHCNFELPEVLLGFDALVTKVTGQSLPSAEQALPTEEMRARFRALAAENAPRLR
jgi:pimeloyl-ACP methyl ester carboxylesterase